jgi:nitrogen fixation NifU-like protein
MAKDNLDRFVGYLNQRIFEDLKKAYSPQVVKRFYHLRNVGVLEDANGYARVNGSCGDTMEIWLKINKEKIARANFMTDGCGPSIVCGSMVTELAVNKTLEEALDIQKEDVLKALGGLPEESAHCASLAAQTLHEAIDDYFRRNSS